MRKWHEEGDTGSLGRLIAACLPMVDRAARKRARSMGEYEQMVSLGYLAMIRAIDRCRDDESVDPVMQIHGLVSTAMEMATHGNTRPRVTARRRARRSVKAQMVTFRDSVAPSP